MAGAIGTGFFLWACVHSRRTLLGNQDQGIRMHLLRKEYASYALHLFWRTRCEDFGQIAMQRAHFQPRAQERRGKVVDIFAALK